MTSFVARLIIDLSVVSRYQTCPPLGVYTSAQYGTAACPLLVSGNRAGVESVSLRPNEINPFSLTCKTMFNQCKRGPFHESEKC